MRKLLWVRGSIAFALAMMAILVLSWVSAWVGYAPIRVQTAVEIDAPRKIVWAILSDFSGYRSWNPNTIEIQGDPAPGGRVDFKAQVGSTVRSLDALIGSVREFEELCWTGPVSRSMRSLFWGEHCFQIEALSPKHVRFTNRERFGGIVSLPLWGYLTGDVVSAYQAANLALKHRAEEMTSRRSPPEPPPTDPKPPKAQ